MGRHLSSFYNPVLAVHALSRNTTPGPQVSPSAATTTNSTSSSTTASLLPHVTNQETSSILRGVSMLHGEPDLLDEVEDELALRPVLKWRDAPFDIDEDREDAVYEAFVSPDGSALPSPTSGHLGATLAFPASAEIDAPSPLDFSDCLDGPPLPPSDSILLHADRHGGAHAQPPMTPSSAVFHTFTLPLTLPAPHERLGSRRASLNPVAPGTTTAVYNGSSSSASSSSTTLSTSASSSAIIENANQSNYRRSTSAVAPRASLPHSHPAGATATSPIQFSLPPAPRWTHRQPPALTAPVITTTPSANVDHTTLGGTAGVGGAAGTTATTVTVTPPPTLSSDVTARPWEVDERAREWHNRQAMYDAQFARFLDELWYTTHPRDRPTH